MLRNRVFYKRKMGFMVVHVGWVSSRRRDTRHYKLCRAVPPLAGQADLLTIKKKLYFTKRITHLSNSLQQKSK